jgi:hypothetical protein
MCVQESSRSRTDRTQPMLQTSAGVNSLQEVINLVSDDDIEIDPPFQKPTIVMDSRVPVFIANDGRTPEKIRKLIWGIEQVRKSQITPSSLLINESVEASEEGHRGPFA